ncbi:ABC transporter permease [Actinocrinis puniceicyclus]|nr:ABC transporter permease [Actinocrinis puniceicyclus]
MHALRPRRERPADADTPQAVRGGRGRRRVAIATVQVALLVGGLGLWQALASSHSIDVSFYGDPVGTWRQLLDWIHHGTTEGPLWQQLWVTLQETFFGFAIGVVLGVTCGIVLGRVKLLSEILAIYIGAFNSIPRLVLGSIFIIWFGLGMPSKIALAVLLVFFNVFFNAFQGAREVDHGLIANARLLGASRLAVLFHVVVPSAFSWLIASLRVAFGLAITGSVVGELLGAQQGLGTLIAQAQGYFNPDGVYAGLVVTTIVALGAEGAITLAEHRLLRWRPPRQTLEPET